MCLRRSSGYGNADLGFHCWFCHSIAPEMMLQYWEFRLWMLLSASVQAPPCKILVQCGISVLRSEERLLRWVILRLNWIDRPVFFLYGFLITHHFDNSVFTCAFTALIPLHHSLSCARTSPINHFLRRLAPSSPCFHYFPSRWCRIFSCLKRGDCGIILQLFESKSIHSWPNQVDSRLPYLSIPIPIHETSNSLNQYLSPILAGKYLQVQHFFISFITRFIKSFKFGPASNKYVSWRQIHPIATNQGKKERIYRHNRFQRFKLPESQRFLPRPYNQILIGYVLPQRPTKSEYPLFGTLNTPNASQIFSSANLPNPSGGLFSVRSWRWWEKIHIKGTQGRFKALPLGDLTKNDDGGHFAICGGL